MEIPISSSIFPYTPLDPLVPQIRLIELQPCRGSDPTVRCAIHVASLTDATDHYDALSYEWGCETSTPCSIELNGQSVSVRENLFLAMQHLRNRREPRMLWIDAVCINQDDDEEKSFQVQQMGDIYQRAQLVVAWVGMPQETRVKRRPFDSTQALQRTEIFLDMLDAYLARDLNSTYSCTEDSWLLVAAGQMQQELQHILRSRTYWSRLWIIQEMVLGRQIIIQCGKFRLRWASLSHLLHGSLYCLPPEILFACRAVLPSLKNSQAARICRQQSSYVSKRQENSLLHCVLTFGSSECSDIRDKVFGLHALVLKCCQEAVQVDYRNSLQAIARRMFLHHLKCHTGHHEAYHEVVAQVKKVAELLRVKISLLPLRLARSSRCGRVMLTQCNRRATVLQLKHNNPTFDSYAATSDSFIAPKSTIRNEIARSTAREVGRYFFTGYDANLPSDVFWQLRLAGDGWLRTNTNFPPFAQDPGWPFEDFHELKNASLLVFHTIERNSKPSDAGRLVNSRFKNSEEIPQAFSGPIIRSGSVHHGISDGGSVYIPTGKLKEWWEAIDEKLRHSGGLFVGPYDCEESLCKCESNLQA